MKMRFIVAAKSGIANKHNATSRSNWQLHKVVCTRSDAEECIHMMRVRRRESEWGAREQKS